MSKENKKQIRAIFRDSVFSRDGFKCRICSCPDKLDAHHITNRNDMPNGGYVKENGISLCEKCHKKAEDVLNGMSYDKDFSSENLYKIIGSTKELAIEKCKNLK